MIKATCRNGLVLAAAVFFVAAAPSAVLAQQADSTAPGGTWTGTYSGGGNAPTTLPFEANVQYGQYYAGFGAGNGEAGGGAGTVSNGQYNSVGASTQAPGQACVLLPGTDIPYACP